AADEAKPMERCPAAGVLGTAASVVKLFLQVPPRGLPHQGRDKMSCMNRRTFLCTSAGAALSLAAPSQPNALVILADDLGWHDVGYHGSEIRTPNIDRLAAQGTQFDRAYSFPVCSPTRSGFMTGRSPMRLGTGYTVIRPWANFGISTEERFLPQAFH